MIYDPFKKPLELVTGADLLKLKDVSEGWYIDYKSAPIESSKIAKHLAAFANQDGGWLFFGVQEGSKKTRCADSFPGIPQSGISGLLDSVKNASLDHISPRLFYTHKLISGPQPEINLGPDRHILIVRIPQGTNSPYIHSSGIVYVRQADASEPCAVTEQALLHRLSRRREEADRELAAFLESTPAAEAEETFGCYVHVFLLTDLNEDRNPIDIDFSTFKAVMTEAPTGSLMVFPWDNYFPAQGGYIARQVSRNDPSYLLPTFRLWLDGDARITIPVSVHSGSLFTTEAIAKYAKEFLRLYGTRGISNARIGDFSHIAGSLLGILPRYLKALEAIHYRGEIRSWIKIEGIKRVSPYLDDANYLLRLKDLGVPIVEESTIRSPRSKRFEDLPVILDLAQGSGELDGEKAPDLPTIGTMQIVFRILRAVGAIDDILQIASYSEMFNVREYGRKRSGDDF